MASLNLLFQSVADYSQSVADYSGATADSDAQQGTASTDLSLTANLPGGNTNNSFDTMLQQNDAQLSAQNQNNNQSNASGQASSSQSSGANAQNTSQNNTQQNASSQQPTQQTWQSNQGGQTSASRGNSNKKTSSGTTPDASNATAAVTQPVSTNTQTQTPSAQTGGTGGNILSELESLLSSLTNEWNAQAQTSQAGQTATPAQDAFLQTLQDAVNDAGSQNGNNAELASKLEDFAQANGQSLSASDLQQINALVAQLTAAPDTSLSNTLSLNIANTSAEAGETAADARAAEDVTHAPESRPAGDTVTGQQNSGNSSAANSNNASGAPAADSSASAQALPAGSATDTGGQDGDNADQSGQHDASPVSAVVDIQSSNAPVAAGAGTFTQALNQAQQPDQTQQPQQASPAEQLVAAVRTANMPGGAQAINIQMAPIHLGLVNIHVEVTPEGNAHMTVTASNPDTLNQLSSDANNLKEILTKIMVPNGSGTLSFNLGNGQPGQGQNQYQGQGQAYGSYAAQSSGSDEALAAAVPQIYTVMPSDGVNIVT